ncbi:protein STRICTOSIDINE SYNTHASE-LIKE 10-like [Hibiscus syriacus]|uniref:protein STRICTOSIDINE SYNTHASE-LIKE 10-like n=1 Tax=Hibiscus syriacus TaxID=106335 RepID=UPI00192513A6|nr:protein STRICTOSIDINE SYNTHASE-LIKE 10-like [Hibiscus syriacus]
MAKVKGYHQINITQGTGPESIAFDCKGEGPYVGISDGRVLKWKGSKFGWTEFAISSPFRKRSLCDGSTNSNLEPLCGRPLGLKFNTETCRLYIADAYFGLSVVGPYGGVAKRLAISAEGIPFRFTNGIDIDINTGMIYFTDSSIIFQRRDVDSLLRSTDRTGRLLKYDPYTRKVYVLYDGLVFPNGVALSMNRSFVLVAESTRMRILKFNLGGEEKIESNAPEVFAELPRVPDNIKRNENGEFWVALNTGRSGTAPNDIPDPIAIKFNQEAKVLKRLDGNGAIAFNSISEVKEFKSKLYIGSVTKPYVSILDV